MNRSTVKTRIQSVSYKGYEADLRSTLGLGVYLFALQLVVNAICLGALLRRSKYARDGFPEI